MKNSILVFAFMLLGLTSAQAGISGTYQGKGEFLDSLTSGVSPVIIGVEIKQVPGRLDFYMRFHSQDGYVVNQELVFQIQESKVFYDDQLVGEYLNDRLIVKDVVIEKVAFSVSIEKNSDGSLSYSDEFCYLDADEKMCDLLKGQLY